MAHPFEKHVSDPEPGRGRVPLRGPTIFLLLCAIVALAGVLTLGLPLIAGIFETIASRP
jgi:hypothetical protein